MSVHIGLAQPKDTHVMTHDKVTIFTDPEHGAKSFIGWGEFPDSGKGIRRIDMQVTLAYPADRAIAHWDYLDRIKILRRGGQKGRRVNFEIGRLLTPYGSNFQPGWSYTWSVDVTDFESFLRDSVEIEYIHTGYESPELGWDLTINFHIDFGPRIAKFISVETLWDGHFNYGNPENDIENSLAPKAISRAAGSAFGRFRIQHTGHGMDSTGGCSEFCRRWREVIVDDQVVDHRDRWKECGDNPLYPQGGTWIFDRGHWCPGYLQAPDIIDVPLTRSQHTVDINMEPFITSDIKQPVEAVTCYFFQFSAPTHSHDVAVEEIMAPNREVPFNRFNPIAFNARIKIRNLGKERLRTAVITYQTAGFAEKTFRWQGDLPFYEDATIKLPGEISARSGLNQFSVTLSEPNGVQDEWPDDNKIEAEFYDVPMLPTRMIIDFLTNNKPEENSLFIVNSSGDTVFMKSPERLKPATHYSDTLALAEGSYFLMLTDSTGDGLEFWFQPESGYGRLRLKDVQGHILHLFESDCGNGEFFAFRCDEDALVDTTAAFLSVNIFPRMVADHLRIYTTTHKPSTLKIRITRDGEYIEEHEYTHIQDSITGMDVSHLKEGRYVMEIYIDGEHRMNRRFNKR